MLFDLRGRGRRRTVQAIYLTLAVLMGGGLVLFGIGGEVSGGLVDAITGNGGGGSDNTFEQQEKKAQEAVDKNPRDAAAWARLARAKFNRARSEAKYFDQNSGRYTEAGIAKLREVDRAWKKHVELAKNPDPSLAQVMVQVYGPQGLNQLDEAVKAQQIVVEANPDDYTAFAQLAILAYAAGQDRVGDLAAQKAVELAPKDEKAALKKRLEQAKKGQQGGGAGATGATPSG